MKKSLFTILFLLVTLSLPAAFKVDNTELTTIVIAADAPDSVQLAATELQKFVQKATGTALEIVTGKPYKTTGNIILGSNQELLKNIGPEGFHICVKDNNLLIAGQDSPSGAIVGIRNPWRRQEVYNEQLKLGAFGQTGTLHGVYYLLENYLGIRFYWPGEIGTVIPPVHDVVLNSKLDFSKEPLFNCRYAWLCDFSVAPEDALWYRRAGFGGVAPIQILDYNWFFTNKLKKSHPEVFALVNGKRDFDSLCAVRGGGHLCYTHPNTVPLVAELICQYFDQHPEHNCFPMLPGDGLARVCGCPNCQAEVNNDGPVSGKFSDHVWGFVNRVAIEVAKRHPNKFVGCSAYDKYADPPRRLKQLSPNVAVQIGKNRSDMASPYYENFYRQRVAAWRKVATNPRFSSSDFYLQTWIPWRGLPCFFPQMIQKDLKAMKREGFIGEFIEAESWWGSDAHRLLYPATTHLNLYITGKLYWDPDLNLDALFEEYCRLFYGPAAAPMRAFWLLSKQRWIDGHKNARDFSIFQIVNPENIFSPEVITKLDSYLAQAKKLCPKESLYAKRIAQLEKEYAIGRATVFVMVRNKPPLMVVQQETEPFIIDGKLTEKSWSKGNGAFFVGYSGESVNANTVAYCRMDNKNLYCGFILAEPHTDKLVAKGKVRDYPDLWQDDCVEIYLMPHDALPWSGYQFIVNPNGILWDCKLNEDKTRDLSWNSHAKSAASVEKHRWTIEIAIPLEDISVVPGQKIKANFYRCRLAVQGIFFSCWSPILTEGHYTPSRFGTLQFSPKTKDK